MLCFAQRVRLRGKVSNTESLSRGSSALSLNSPLESAEACGDVVVVSAQDLEPDSDSDTDFDIDCCDKSENDGCNAASDRDDGDNEIVGLAFSKSVTRLNSWRSQRWWWWSSKLRVVVAWLEFRKRRFWDEERIVVDGESEQRSLVEEDVSSDVHVLLGLLHPAPQVKVAAVASSEAATSSPNTMDECSRPRNRLLPPPTHAKAEVQVRNVSNERVDRLIRGVATIVGAFAADVIMESASRALDQPTMVRMI